MKFWAFARVVVVAVVAAMVVVGHAEARPTPTRTVLVFDNSGSMRKNDPHRLAQAAAMLYVQLAKKGDEIGLVVFGDRARVAVPLTPFSSARMRLSHPLAGLRLDAATTDIGAALETALRTLGPPKAGASDVVVLLTDGRVDLGRGRQEALRTELVRIRTSVAARYRARGVPLYAIAFTEEADRVLLEELAGQTHGSFRFITSARDLHRAFSQMFAMASSASSLPVREGQVVVDDSIRQTSLVLSKSSEAPNAVLAPDEEVLRGSSRRHGVKWKTSGAYDLIELTKPQTGPWQMLGPDGTPVDAMAIVQDSSLDLDVSFGPKDATVDDPMTFLVKLVEDGGPVRNFARLKNMSVEAIVESPSGRRRTQLFEAQPTAPGEFIGRFINPEAGHYAIQVSAASPVLQRQWKGAFLVRPRCFLSEVRTDTRPPLAMIRLAPECPKYREVSVEMARHLAGTEPVFQPVPAAGRGYYEGTVSPLGPGERGGVQFRLRAVTQDGDRIELMPPEVPLLEAAPGAWLEVVGKRFMLINIPILAVAGVVIGVMQLRRRQELDSD